MIITFQFFSCNCHCLFAHPCSLTRLFFLLVFTLNTVLRDAPPNLLRERAGLHKIFYYFMCSFCFCFFLWDVYVAKGLQYLLDVLVGSSCSYCKEMHVVLMHCCVHWGLENVIWLAVSCCAGFSGHLCACVCLRYGSQPRV